MYPANHYMDPYHSHYRNHTPYPYYPPPGWEIPFGHPRAMDPSYRPPTYGPWTYNAGMHHPHPSEIHCCCNHTYPPDHYSFRPPLPQEFPPPHLYYHEPFPQHSNVRPSYFPPHPYPVDQMPYGHDKLKSHCCGCPNHVCHGAEKSNVRIEEERPDVKLESEHKDPDSGSIIRYPNSQYPFLWLPANNMEGKENGKRYELTPQLLNAWPPLSSSKRTGDVKQQEQDNQLLNGWAPVSGKRTGDVKHQEQDNQKEKQFHWPIVWMPAGYDGQKQNVKEMEETENVPKAPNKQKAREVEETEDVPKALNNSEDVPRSPKIKIIPLSWFENGHHDQKPASMDGSGDLSDKSAVKNQPAVTEHRGGMTLQGRPKTTTAVPKRVNDERKPAREIYKTIPVVPAKESDEKKASTCRTIPVVKESDDNEAGMSEKKEAKKASNAEKVEENGKTKHSESSTAKHSKLPPVCLRVDPFPRKKSANGSSRSSSPPTRKDGDKAKEAQGQNLEPKQSDTRHITVSENVPTSKDDQKVQAGSKIIGTQENAGAKSLQGGAVQENASAESFKGCDKSKIEDEKVTESEAAKDDARTCRANLSELDAAVRIQSAYRGYDVRRWQPLDKLRKISNVHEQMEGVKKQLQCLEDSCKKPTEKDQVAIGETIMNLLLRLDTVQGLHPSVREARKSVARELVYLQEKLDALCKQPSGEFDHTNSDEEKSERAENIIQIAAPTETTEASDKENRAVELGKVEEPSSVNSVEPCDAVPSEIPVEVKQDADASEQNNEKEEESCSTTIQEANEEGKAADQFELKVPSSMDMISAALPEYPTDNQEHEIEESNAVSVEQVIEEKPVVEGEGKEAPLVNSTEPLHDAASAGGSSGLKQCTVSTDQNLHAESNTGLSSASTEDMNASAAAASVESGVATERGVPVDGQVHGTTDVENLELKHDVSPAEQDQQRELSGPAVHLDDSSVSLQAEEGSVMYNTAGQSEEDNISMEERAVDAMQDSTKEPDGTPVASTNNIELSASADTEKPDQPALLEPTLNSAPEQTLLDESDDTRDEIVLPALDSCELSCAHEGGITGHERSEAEVSSESQTDAQKEHADVVVSETDECIETLKQAPVDTSGANSAEDVGVQVSVTEKSTEMPEDAQVAAPGSNPAEDIDVQVSVTEKCTEDAPERAAGTNPAEEETDHLKEDIAVHTENKASEEALSAAATPDDVLKASDERKLAEENQQLKELLQKLLTSGNDQMGVITDLSEKVKALERKLAHKKRSKVRVHRPSGHAIAKVR